MPPALEILLKIFLDIYVTSHITMPQVTVSVWVTFYSMHMLRHQ